ncbi:MAG: hypothetical protein EOO74_08695, partial [Myxococcales bacterium]
MGRWVMLSLVLSVGCSRASEPAPRPDADRVDTAVQTPVAVVAPVQPAAAPVAAAPVASTDRCPANMVLVEGMACTNVKQECIDWAEDPVKNPYARCIKFKEPSECIGPKVPMAFCIDREEYVLQGEEVPVGDVSWTEAKRTCEALDKRLCQETEWTFACEGEQALPYPYGYERNPAICNFEQQDVLNRDTGKMYDLRQSIAANPQCVSPSGVHNLVGNIDEWVVLDKPHFSAKNGGRKMMSGLKGGWWGPLRNRCRPVTVDHDEVFHELQTGFRCCADAKGKVAQGSDSGK